MKYEYDIIEQKLVYEGFLGIKKFILRHGLFRGGQSPDLQRERVESYGAASVLLYDPDRDQVVMIEQFRIGALSFRTGAWMLEVVGGIVEDTESPDSVARREAIEEAGCEVTEMEFICDFLVSPGYSTERIHLYCGRVDSSAAGGVHGLEHEGEDIRVETMTTQQAFEELYTGRINSTSSLIAVQWLALNHDRLQREWCGRRISREDTNN